MKKRSFLLMGLGAAGALTVGWGLLPPRQRLTGVALPLTDGQVALNAWLKLNKDNTITLAMPKSEMGQGVFTALAMIVAEELDVPLSAVRIEQSPIDRLYGNVVATASGIPFRPDDEGALARTVRWTMTKVARELGIMMTGGSSSVADLWLPLRQATAMAKAALLLGDKFTLGDTIQYKLKDAKDFKLLGKPTPRTDIHGKVNGRAAFGIDAAALNSKRPDFYAAVLLSPARGGAVAKVDTKTAIVLQPNINGSGTSGGIAVVAKSYWQAKTELDALKIEWAQAATSTWSNETVTQTLATALDKEDGFTYWNKGDAKALLAQAISSKASQPTHLTATYSAPYLAHATMEPMNATVSLIGKGAERKAIVTVGTQVPDLARAAAAKALGVAKENVTLKVPFLGGGFGRRLEVDIVTQAASIAASHFGTDKEGTLQVIWSRQADMQHDFYRPAALAKFEAGLDKDGNITAWVNKSAGQNIVPQYFARNVGLPMAGPDKTSSEGAFDQAYEFASAHVSHVAVDMPIPVGFWRSVGHSHQAFFQESFLDECAQASKPKDAFVQSVAYRRSLLKNHPRHLAVLDLAVSKHGGALPERSLGVALHESFGSIVAMVAEVSVGESRKIRVHKMTAAVDCGFCINPLGVAAQVESSVAFGLSAALFGKIDVKDGKVQQSNFHDYRVLRINEMPIVQTHIIPSARAPEGMGEPALPPVAPAVANAVFALTGERLRSLPLALA
ncbi:MAG: molybdopterin-dependent oxidoreductase [Cytophagales bacterium]|nr:molybdopterin-dependent oxidoreductase [Cytophagales bacterium]